MLLYDKKDKSFDIYKMTEKENEAKNFRRLEMCKANLDDKIYFSRTKIEDRYFNHYTKEQVDNSILSKYYFDNYMDYYLFLYSNSMRAIKEIINNYYDGKYKENLIARFKTSGGIRNFLLTEDNYVQDDKKTIYIMDNIIELPNSLYILQLLEREKLDKISKYNIARQLKLFNINKSGEVSFEELQKTDRDGITKNAYISAINKAKSSAHILQLIKK